MTEFEKKLPLYKTAFSPEFNTFVGIKSVFFCDDSEQWMVQATVAGEGSRMFEFLVSDLTDYCL